MRSKPEPDDHDDDSARLEHAAATAPIDPDEYHLARVEIEAKDILRRLERGLGVALRAPRPVGNPPQLPARLTKLSSAEVSDLYGVFASWGEYVGDELHLARTVLLLIQEEETQQNARARLDASSRGAKRDEAIVANAPIRRARCIAEARVVLLQPKIESWDRCIHVLSREQTRRGMEMEHLGGSRRR